MGNARKARRAGRARLHRLRKDHAVIGDDRRYAQACTLASSAHPERSLEPSNWDQVIGRVQRYREVYKHLSQASISKWYKIANKLRIEDRVVVDGTVVSLAMLRKIATVAAEVAEDPERAAQLAQLAADTRGDVWQQVM